MDLSKFTFNKMILIKIVVLSYNQFCKKFLSKKIPKATTSQNKALSSLQKSPHSELGSNPTWNFHVKLYIEAAKSRRTPLLSQLSLCRTGYLTKNRTKKQVQFVCSSWNCQMVLVRLRLKLTQQLKSRALSLDGKTQGTLKFSYKVGRTEEYQLVGYASPNPGVMVGSIFKVLGEEITVALILVGVSFGVAQTADSLL